MATRASKERQSGPSSFSRPVALTPHAYAVGSRLAVGTNAGALRVVRVPSDVLRGGGRRAGSGGERDEGESDGGNAPPQTLRVSRDNDFRSLHVGSVYAVAWDPSGQVSSFGRHRLM